MEDLTPAPPIYCKIADRMPLRAASSTVAIVTYRDGRLWQCGTGTLVRFAALHFLITAGHVYRETKRREQPLFLATGAEDSRICTLGGDITITNEKQRGGDDSFDLAMWHLDDATLSELSAEKRFLDQTDLWFGDEKDAGAYFVYGFPEVWAQAENSNRLLVIQPLSFTTHPPDRSFKSLPNYNPRYHLVLENDQEWVRGTDGKPISFPSRLQGISGASVWKTFSDNHDMDSWHESRAKVVAVETCVYLSSHLMRATRWASVLTMLKEVYPQLGPSLGLLLPRHC